jgi:hypothetical protein
VIEIPSVLQKHPADRPPVAVLAAHLYLARFRERLPFLRRINGVQPDLLRTSSMQNADRASEMLTTRPLKSSVMSISIRNYKLTSQDPKTRGELTRQINDLFLPQIGNPDHRERLRIASGSRGIQSLRIL